MDVDTTRKVVEEFTCTAPGGLTVVQQVHYEWYPHSVLSVTFEGIVSSFVGDPQRGRKVVSDAVRAPFDPLRKVWQVRSKELPNDRLAKKSQINEGVTAEDETVVDQLRFSAQVKVSDQHGGWKSVVKKGSVHAVISSPGQISLHKSCSIEQKVVDQGPQLSAEQVLFLNRDFCSAEVKEAVFSIDDDKTPGIDGFPVVFFKQCWPITGDECWKSFLTVRDVFLPWISFAGDSASFDGRGCYVVKHGYRVLRGCLCKVPCRRLVWSQDILSRHQLLLWLAVKNRFAQEVAEPFLMRLKLQRPARNWRDWMVNVTRGKTEVVGARRKWLAAVVYGIWHERNSRIFKACATQPLAVVRRIESSC
ncbi:hypothetical protein Dimus_002963 [Dionaea muscipula]